MIWRLCVQGPEGATIEYWRNMVRTPFARNHPTLQRRDWKMSIPLGFHGDAGSFSKQDSVFMFTWNSLVASGPGAAKRFLFTLIKKSEMSADTIDDILKVFVYSVNVCLTGRFPFRDIYMEIKSRMAARNCSREGFAVCSRKSEATGSLTFRFSNSQDGIKRSTCVGCAALAA